MDDRGVLRGHCTSQDCDCSQYERQERVKRCTCGHPPAKHAKLTGQSIVHGQSSVGDDVTLDSDLEQYLSLDDSQSASVSSGANVSSVTVNAPVATQAWAGPIANQSLIVTAGPMPIAACGPAQHYYKCAIPECHNPRYIDPSGHVHECCGFNHAMELQRRQVIESAPVVKGVTHCLLPCCNSIVWPFMNYCCKTHANFGASMGLQPPVAQAAVGAPGPSAPFLQVKDDTMCLLPQCHAKRYREADGTVHPYCGRTHAQLAKSMNIAEHVAPGDKCIIPECTKKRYTDGSVAHHYCSKSHADEGRRRGIFPSAQDTKDQCDLPNCTRPKAVEVNGYKYNYCCRDHALKDDQNILTKRDAVDTFLKQFSNVLTVVNLVENQSAKSGGRLFQKFQSAWRSLNPSNRKTILAFHGTPKENIQSICNNGFDPSKRSGQAYGKGEYFAKTPGVPMGYCQGGKKMLLCELLLGQVNTHHTIHGDYVVMKDPAHDLPRFVVEFS